MAVTADETRVKTIPLQPSTETDERRQDIPALFRQLIVFQLEKTKRLNPCGTDFRTFVSTTYPRRTARNHLSSLTGGGFLTALPVPKKGGVPFYWLLLSGPDSIVQRTSHAKPKIAWSTQAEYTHGPQRFQLAAR